jgi:MFS family permease
MSQTALPTTTRGPRIGRTVLCVLVIGVSVVGTYFSLIVWGFLTKKVGYRWFDVFGLLVPILGIIWLCRWAWRIVNVDDAYWEELSGYSREAPQEVRQEWETREPTPYEAKMQAMRERGDLP